MKHGRTEGQAYKENGMMTFFVLWLGLMALFFAMAVSSCAGMYLKQACRYRDSVQMTYIAESSLLLSWEKLKQQPWDDYARQKKFPVQDEFDLFDKHHAMTVQVYTEKYQKPYHGALLAAGIDKRLGLTRTCSLVYDIDLADQALPILTVNRLVP